MENASLFDDDSNISDYARDSVYFMSSKGIIKGMGDNRFESKGNATIEQSLIILERICDKYHE